jgi:1-acyl-sn-glycerol-3-phosphate acyltransferase
MAKDELFKNKILAWFFTKLGAFPVNRRTGDKGAINRAQQILSEGKVLGIFPEGTRHPGEAPHKAKPGAAMLALATKATIVPSAVYRNEGKVRLFQKASFRFGAPIPFSEYGSDEVNKSAIRSVSQLITEKITELWEMKH